MTAHVQDLEVSVSEGLAPLRRTNAERLYADLNQAQFIEPGFPDPSGEVNR